MPLPFPDRLIDELCHNGDLEDYRETIRDILSVITATGIKVSTRYDVSFSNIESPTDNITRIRVSLKNVKAPLNIIWQLLHEFGHFLSGKAKPGDTLLFREELAWQFADKLLGDFPALTAHKKEYEKHKLECLNSYRKLYNT